MKLPEYKDLSEKNNWFQQFVIKTEEELKRILEHHRSNGNYIYRGVGESKYKLYNSYQRINNTMLLQEQHEFRNYNRSAINEAQMYQNGLLRRYLESINCLSKDYATLSFLQHNGAPTPLIDFTTDQDVALYFMSQKEYFESEIEINNYFSLYLVNTDFLFNANKLRKKYTEYIDEKLNAFEIVTSNVKSVIEFQLSMEPKLLSPMIELINEDSENYKYQMYLNNNLNIISQKGVFILNTFPNKPLETAYKIDITNRTEDLSEQINKNNYIVSIDIHKSLRESIVKHLNKNNIVKETIYPKAENIVNYITNKEYER